MIHPCKHALCHTKKQNVQRGIPGIVRGMWPKHWLKLVISSKHFRLQSCIEKAQRKNWKLATWTCWITAFKIPKLDVLCPVLAVKRCKVCNGWQKKHQQVIKIVTWKLAIFCKTKPNLRGTHTCSLAMFEWTFAFKIWFNVNESTSMFFPTWKHYLQSSIFMLQLCRVTKYALFGHENHQKFQKACTSLQWLQKTWYIDVNFMLPCSEMATGLVDFQFSSSKPLKRCST